MKLLDSKTFNRKLSGGVRSAKSQRDNIQALILSGLAQYKEHGNAGQLSSLLAAYVGVKSVPTVTIKDYIKEHANVKYAKNKDGDHVFSKDGGKGVERVVTEPLETWYDWKKAKHNNVKEVNYLKRLTTDVSKLIAKGTNKAEMVQAILDGGMSTSELLSLIDSLSVHETVKAA